MDFCDFIQIICMTIISFFGRLCTSIIRQFLNVVLTITVRLWLSVFYGYMSIVNCYFLILNFTCQFRKLILHGEENVYKCNLMLYMSKLFH